MDQDVTYREEILSEYLRIAGNNLAQKITFYRKNEKRLSNIPINERLDIDVDFLTALFQNGEYEDYLKRCDVVMDQLFDSEIFPKFEKKILKFILFHKAACLFNLHKLEDSQETLRKLIRIDKINSASAQDQLCVELLKRIFRKKRQLFEFQSRGIVIALILLSAILSVWSVLVIGPFYPEYYTHFQIAMVALFVMGIGIWVIAFFYSRSRAHDETKKFMRLERSEPK